MSAWPNLDNMCMAADEEELSLNDIIDRDDFRFFGDCGPSVQLETTPLVMAIATVINIVEGSLFTSKTKTQLKDRMEKLVQFIEEEGTSLCNAEIET